MNDPTTLLRVIAGESVFDLNTDTLIRQAANEMSARLMLELFARCDLSTAEGMQRFVSTLMESSSGDPSILVSFDDGRWEGKTSDEIDALPETSSVHYLKLRFTNAEACYYQYHLFPTLDEPFITEGARKREGDTQYLMVGLTRVDRLQVFIQNLRGNPHLVALEESSKEEFAKARSEAV